MGFCAYNILGSMSNFVGQEAIGADSDCRTHDDNAGTECGSAITTVFAAAASMGQYASVFGENCQGKTAGTFKINDPYLCGYDIGEVSIYIRAMSAGIGAAVANCGLPFDDPQVTQELKQPIGFYRPQSR